MPKKILLIAGLDPTGHAGLLRDVEVCLSFGQSYFAFPTALTAQTDKEYLGTAQPNREYCNALIQCLPGRHIAGVKIGMLTNKQILGIVVALIRALKSGPQKIPVVWDPVFRSTSGGELLTKSGINRAKTQLLPLADITTCNAIEICELLRLPYSKKQDPLALCTSFFARFKRPVYLKGGHLEQRATDYFYDGTTLKKFGSQPQPKKIRGTGCLLSTALACELAKGKSLIQASRLAKDFVNRLFRQLNPKS